MSLNLKRKVSIERLIATKNVCDLLPDDDIAAIGAMCAEGFSADKSSRAQWARRKANANKLALQVVENKTFPWPHASNIKFPLVTVAALAFQARAYPALISGTELVKARVYGPDPKGEERARGERIAAHMTWQCLEQDRGWEEEIDRAIFATGIAGCTFIKQGFDPSLGRISTQLVLPKDLVVNYFTRSLADSPRYTHTFNLTRNEIHSREADGRYRKFPKSTEEGYAQSAAPIAPDTTDSQDEIQAARDQRQGITNPETDNVTPFFTGEQYCWIDLDGDGYEEPYVVVFDIGSSQVRRIFPRFLPSGVKLSDGQKLSRYQRADSEGQVDYDLPKGVKVSSITPVRVFTKVPFIPSPDGGFYDLGLGDLAGPINWAVNSGLDSLFDASTIKNLGGGFLGRAFKGRGGPMTFAPQQWYPLDNAGDDIRKSVMPLPVPEPSEVMFKLIGFLVQYAERIVSSTDIQMGESPGQNMKAGTAEILNQNGQRVYSSIFKRMWRAFRELYDIRYDLNSLFFDQDEDFTDLTTGEGAMVRAQDYQGKALLVRPAADPHVVSDHEAEMQATRLVQLANQAPGFNRYRSTLRLLKAWKVPNIEEIYPQPMMQDPKTGQQVPAPDIPPPPNAKLLDVQVKEKKLQIEMLDTMATLQLEVKESAARVDKLRAEALKLAAEAKGLQVEPLIKLIYAQIESEGNRRDHLLKRIEVINDTLETMNGIVGQGGDSAHPGMGGMAGSPANAGVSQGARPNGKGVQRTVA